MQNLKIMNQACLLKLGWKLHNKGMEYWCKVLKGKYEGNRENFGMTKNPTDSSLWKTLVDLRPMLDLFSFWTIRKWCNIDAWHHAWIE